MRFFRRTFSSLMASFIATCMLLSSLRNISTLLSPGSCSWPLTIVDILDFTSGFCFFFFSNNEKYKILISTKIFRKRENNYNKMTFYFISLQMFTQDSLSVKQISMMVLPSLRNTYHRAVQWLAIFTTKSLVKLRTFWS